jgi:hypothetical protein
VGNKEAVISGARHRVQVCGFGKGVSNLGDVFAVARGTSVAHTVGVRSVYVGAVKHVTIEVVFAKLVLVKAIPGYQFRFLLNVHQTLLSLCVSHE